jgi:hypothetical protein
MHEPGGIGVPRLRQQRVGPSNLLAPRPQRTYEPEEAGERARGPAVALRHLRCSCPGPLD